MFPIFNPPEIEVTCYIFVQLTAFHFASIRIAYLQSKMSRHKHGILVNAERKLNLCTLLSIPFIRPAIYLINNLSASNVMNERKRTERNQLPAIRSSFCLLLWWRYRRCTLYISKKKKKKFYDQLFWFPQNHSHNLCSIWNRY